MKIPKRLQVIGDFIPEGAHVADIGADHGLLEQYIFLTKKQYKVLAVENKIGPFNKLLKNVQVLKNVVASYSNGLDEVDNNYNTLVLAGMGGDNIINILSEKISKLNKVEKIIIDAHSFIPKARREIVGFGFAIEKEIIVYEKGKYYIIISFKRNVDKKNYSEEELDFGYKLYEDPLFNEYKKASLNELQNIRDKIEKLPNEKTRFEQITNQIRRFEIYGKN